VIVLALVIGVGMMFVVRKVMDTRHNPVLTGWEELIGAEATVRQPLEPVGQVFVQGALWRARSTEDERIDSGDRVRVESVDGLTLEVRTVAAGDEQPGEQREGRGT
jgi:membrane-bound serine protease (ClpP class)